MLLVGFEPHRSTGGGCGVAVKSLVALRHVDSPKPWGEATENEALADAVIDELGRRGLVTTGKTDWLRALLRSVLETARTAGITAVSLSVERANFAARLYEAEGFRTVKSFDHADTMLADLKA